MHACPFMGVYVLVCKLQVASRENAFGTCTLKFGCLCSHQVWPTLSPATSRQTESNHLAVKR